MAGYDVYLSKTLFPIAPEKISMKINGKNTVYDLINDGEMNILKLAGLTTVSFTVLLPAVQYPFANYSSGFKPPSYYLDKLEKLKQDKKGFQFIVARKDNMKGRKKLHNTNMTVSLEDYTVKDDAGEGFDIRVEINLKQYKKYSTKTFRVETPSPTAPIAIEPQRPETTSDPPKQQQGYKYSVRVYYSGSSGAVSSVVGYSNISVADARKKAWAKVPGNAQWASETKKQATNQSPPLTDKALEAARKRVAASQTTTTTTVKKPNVNKQPKNGAMVMKQ